jgi:hypothetical protein
MTFVVMMPDTKNIIMQSLVKTKEVDQDETNLFPSKMNIKKAIKKWQSVVPIISRSAQQS